MSYVMNMGNNRMNRIKILQQEKQRNQQLRKTGGNTTPTIEKHTTTTKLHYSRCPYCNQQVLTTTLQHHISFCKSAFKPRTKGNCTACEQFRRK